MHRKIQLGAVLATGVLLALSFIGAEFVRDQPLHHVPTVVALPVLARWAWKGRMSDASMGAILAFVGLHILGARYVYSYVPYDEWSRAWCGVSIQDTFHFTRNHYDRVVHALYGALAMVPQVELLQRRFRFAKSKAICISLVLVFAMSVLYEIFEWLLAIVVSPETADRYNGQQGDAFDAPKDVILALVGALVAGVVMWASQRIRAAWTGARSAGRMP